MKTLLSNHAGYKTYIEFRDAVRPQGLSEMRLLTQWEDARDPEDFQVKLSLILTEQERQHLKELL